MYFNIYFVYFSTPNMDMFATSFFWSPFPDPHAWCSNYLIVHWIGMFVYEFPPPIFLFLAPFSQRWSWFLDQLQLLIDFQKELPVLRNLLPQVRKLFIHPSPESLHYESTENGVLTTRKIQLRPQQLSWKTFSSTYNVRKERNCKPNTIIGYMLEKASYHKGWSTSNTFINDNSKLQK